MTKTNIVPFNQLNEVEKKERLATYEAEQKARGTEQVLARIAVPVKIKDIKDDAKIAVIRVAIYDKETDKTDFSTMTAYIAKGKASLEKFYAGLNVGQLVSAEYKQNGDYRNIYNLMLRETNKEKAI